jgi:hypothetical protein
MVCSTVSKVLQNTYLAQNAATSPRPHDRIPADQGSQQLLRGEEALIKWVRATQSKGTQVTRNMLRRQAAILAAEQWQSVHSTEPWSNGYTPADRPEISPIEPSNMSSSLLSLDWLDSEFLAGAANPYSSSASREETPIPDLLSCHASGLLHNPDLAQLQGNAGCGLADMSNVSMAGLSELPRGQDTTGHALSGLMGASLPTELADLNGCRQATHSLADNMEYPASSLSRGHAAVDVSLEESPCITDRVCLHEAQRALSALERYLAGLPGPTALDQLCLNHVRGRLGR